MVPERHQNSGRQANAHNIIDRTATKCAIYSAARVSNLPSMVQIKVNDYNANVLCSYFSNHGHFSFFYACATQVLFCPKHFREDWFNSKMASLSSSSNEATCACAKLGSPFWSADLPKICTFYLPKIFTFMFREMYIYLPENERFIFRKNLHFIFR